MSRWKLNSLQIRNYRALESLFLKKIGRINLITGRNNVGKTSILEAVRLLASQQDINALLDIIDARDESLLPDNEPKNDRDERQGEYSLLGSLCLFSGYPSIESAPSPIEILGDTFSLRIFVEDSKKQQDLLPELEEELDGLGAKFKILKIISEPVGRSVEFPLPSYYSGYRRHRSFDRRMSESKSRIPCISLASATMDNIGSYNASILWDNVALTDKEEFVLRGLKVIEPRITRVNFVRGGRRDRIPVIKMEGVERPVPLHGLGDGVTRLFEIMLALVNSENGFLLIDEFENGLHYSVQETAWETVLELSEILNVQVFATTHSNDCIEAFQRVASGTEDKNALVLTRLLKDGDSIHSETLSKEIPVPPTRVGTGGSVGMNSDAGHVILVEGINDLHTIAGFLRKLGLTDRLGGDDRRLYLRWKQDGSRLDIISAGSVGEARDFEKTLKDLDAFGDASAIALIVDADTSHENRWRSISGALKKLGHNPPTNPAPEGTVVCANDVHPPRIGVWIMPDNQRAGMLETFLGTCVPDGPTNPVWMAAQEGTAAVQQAIGESIRFKDTHVDKAKVHSYLSWTDPPGLPFGQAILKGILNPESEQASVFLNWIRNVFDFDGVLG